MRHNKMSTAMSKLPTIIVGIVQKTDLRLKNHKVARVTGRLEFDRPPGCIRFRQGYLEGDEAELAAAWRCDAQFHLEVAGGNVWVTFAKPVGNRAVVETAEYLRPGTAPGTVLVATPLPQ